MPIAADKERELLNRYRIQSVNPLEWPHQQDGDESESDEEEGQRTPTAHTRHQSKPSLSSSVSKYHNIGRHASIQSGLSGTQKTARGEDSLVQKDERDPLGQHPSVVSELRKRGLPVEDNIKLRNRFMLSSTSFSPQMFLSNVHQDATTDDLLRGLDFLSRSIDEKSASLKVLVESNFEKFVRAKATIDNVYTEMRSQGAAAPAFQEPASRRPNSRHTNSHFRNTSNSFQPSTKAVPVDKARKTSLTKESEYGIQGLKAPLVEITIKADEIWGPALGGREKETGLKAIVTTLDQHKEIYKLSASCEEAIRKNDYDTVVTNWNKARKAAHDARQLAENARANRKELADHEVQQLIVTARMWHEVHAQIEVFKQDVWRRLKTSHGKRPSAVPEETMQELHMELIGVLLQLGVDENPIWQWLSSRVLYLRDRIARSFERSRIEIEILRRRSGQLDDDPKRLTELRQKDTDSSEIIAFWEKVLHSMGVLLNDILGEVIEFWQAAKDFIENKAQKKFPTPVFAAGLEHLSLEPDEVENITSGAMELVNLIRDSIQAFFTEPPVADLSELYSPIPPTPVTPGSAKRAFTFDPATVPAPPAKKGDVWDKFAFWPPKGNSLSGSHYLSQLMALVGTAAAEMANMSIVRSQKTGSEALKSLVGAVRERCVQAVVAAWIPDAERSRYMESWVRSVERKDLTTMPAAFISFQERVLANMQKIAYVSEAASLAGRGGEEVVVPPSAKLLQMIRGAFVTSLYKALSGMVENAEKTRPEGNKDGDPDGITEPLRGLSVEGEAADSSSRNVRMLMTLSNLSFLRTETIPQLISQFESSFSVKLTEESKTIRDVLTQIDARLFQSYVKPTADHIQSLITRGITDPSWPPTSERPDNARQYIYEVLLSLVYVHAEVSTTAAPLTSQILAYLLEQAGVALITAFRARPRYTLPSLMQATLDVEFLAQTLNNYTTDRASEVQSQIYLVLDERTEADARARLEGELPEMRGVLKRLREGTKGQFGCFRRERKPKDGKGSQGGSAR